jgi:hypothetical protein
MLNRHSLPILLLPLCLAALPAAAETVGVTGSPVYVTRDDCRAVVQHRPAPGVEYQPGVDVHGKYVAPADLPGSQMPGLVPDRIQFDIKLNPLVGLPAGQTQKYANTALPVAHVEVDMKTGEARLNGQPLNGEQNQALLEACRKAGFK